MATVTRERKSSKPARKPEPTVSLCLAIDHTVYSVTATRAEDPDVIRAWRLEKKGSDGAVYDVAVTVHGFDCTCPDFEVRRRGLDAGGCKHCKSCVAAGLLDAPLAPVVNPNAIRVDQPPPAPTPVNGDHLPDMGKMVALAPVSECDRAEAEDAGDPSTWGPEWDNWFWTAASVDEPDPTPDDDDSDADDSADNLPGPDGGTYDPFDGPEDDLPGHPDAWTPRQDADGPTAEDMAEFAEWGQGVAAKHHLDASDRMTLPELVERQQAFFSSWGNAAGDMLAAAMAELALKVRLTSANTPAEYAARIEVLDGEIREQWMASAADAARDAAGIGSAWGHDA